MSSINKESFWVTIDGVQYWNNKTALNFVTGYLHPHTKFNYSIEQKRRYKSARRKEINSPLNEVTNEQI